MPVLPRPNSLIEEGEETEELNMDTRSEEFVNMSLGMTEILSFLLAFLWIKCVCPSIRRSYQSEDQDCQGSAKEEKHFCSDKEDRGEAQCCCSGMWNLIARVLTIANVMSCDV